MRFSLLSSEATDRVIHKAMPLSFRFPNIELHDKLDDAELHMVSINVKFISFFFLKVMC